MGILAGMRQEPLVPMESWSAGHKKSPEDQGFCKGWETGLEPATPGTTNQCSNQLSYNHHF